ncbi:MAG TPA: hypothetical protein QGF88_07025, partial [Gammaproteobacteria bacterium]|nr:hypothetical protein [Gammaproteobacteria bacterium]
MIRIYLLILIFSHQVLGQEQSLDQNHFDQITFDQDTPLIQKWVTCYPDCSSQNKNSFEINTDFRTVLKIMNSKGDSHNDYVMTSRKVGD